jgi:hypothetical protein
MKRTIVLLLAILIAEKSSAKRMLVLAPVPKPQYAVKVYNTFSYQSITDRNLYPLITTSKNITFLKPSVAFMWTDKKGHTREIELSSFSLNKRDDRTAFGTVSKSGQVVTSTDIAIRVERIFNFAKRKQWKLKPSLGCGVMPYFNMAKATPYTSVNVPFTDMHYGVKAYVAPRINYNVSNRFFIDLNIPLVFADMGVQHQKAFNPGLLKEISYNVGNFDAFSESPSVRLGVGLRL